MVNSKDAFKEMVKDEPEFNLSEKIKKFELPIGTDTYFLIEDYLFKKDVKEFIKRFLDFFGYRECHTEISFSELYDKMRELAGDELK